MFRSRKYENKNKSNDEIDDKENEPNKIKGKQDKISQALSLPVLCNMNPRSVYNKIEEFHTFVKEELVDAIFMSESWERENLTLDQIIELEDYEVI